MNYNNTSKADGTFGLTRLRIQIAKENGISINQLRSRLNLGWDIQRAITQKIKGKEVIK